MERIERRGSGIPGLIGKLFMLMLGVVVGVFAGAVLLDRPEVAAAGWQAISEEFQRLRHGQYAFPRMVSGLLLLLLVFASVYILLRSTALIGIVLGALAWVPFGQQMLAQAPELRESFPDLEPNLARLVGERDELRQLRDMGLALLPLPEGIAAPADVAATGTAGLGTDENMAARMPQITNEGTE
ncbi:hypothetical protein [Algicella marina]|uniref:Uncharacterized protein n=1 Tax=Algicella marina TaxID=2683284 RepID=A0A6P1SVW4_9RHOB|nr:hypothetical protein [Algicella marina]QHQ34814.1 hypothetical protein GO499_06180 [Algicella marina]